MKNSVIYRETAVSELKKIAHVMRRFTFEKWGGTETVVYQICKQLDKAGVSSGIFCTDIFSRSGIEWMDGIPVHRHRYVFPWLFLDAAAKRKLQLKGGSPLSLSLLFSLLREPNVSVIHTHVQHRLGGTARTVARLRGIPYVVSIHGGYYTIPQHHRDKMTAPFQGHLEWGKAFGWLLGSRKTLEDADAVVCVGQDEYEQVRLRHPNKRIEYIPNGVDLEKFRQGKGESFKQANGLSPDSKIVLCVSRIDYQKNQELLVRAFASFVGKHPEYHLVLVGPVNVEEYCQTIKNEAKRCGVDQCLTLIPGYAPDDPALVDAYHAADLFVLPSRMEPFGIVILEAWASGVPVIASNVGGIPGFTTDERDVLLFPDNDEPALVKCMERVSSDGELQRSLIAAGKETVQQYSWDRVGAKMLQLYQDLQDKCERSRHGTVFGFRGKK